MPVYKVTRYQNYSYTAFIEAESQESAEWAAQELAEEDWIDNQDLNYDYESRVAAADEYSKRDLFKA